MRVAMIGSRGLPAGVGGVERVVEGLSRALAESGDEVLVYGRGHYALGGNAIAGVRSILTPGLAGKHFDTFTHSATSCWDVLRRDADVVHIHSPGPAVWSFLPRLAGMPILLTIHAPDWRRQRWSAAARAVLRAGLRVGMRSADAVTSVAPHLAEELAERFGRHVEVVENFVPPPGPPHELPECLNLTAGRYVLHVGRIVPEKRLDILLKAWREANPPMPLVVVGEATESIYARRCRSVAPASVRFLGPRFGPELDALYDNAASVAQPSVLEGASLVLMEAAIRGRCVIAADIPANRDVLGQTAAYFPPDDSAVLSERLGSLLADDSARRELGEAARKRIRERFGLQQSVEKYRYIYRRIMEQRPR